MVCLTTDIFLMKKNLLLVCALLLSKISIAQINTDLISVDVKYAAGKLVLVAGSEAKITDRPLYDNQPNFINEKQLAFSAADEKGNHDIIIYNFESGKFTNLTKTSDYKEYSPSLTDCRLYVSAITVEPDGKQRLWLYPTNFGEPELLYDDIEPVGYYDWYNNKAVMFVLGSPNKLVYPYSKSDILTIGQNVGRSVKKRPGTSIVTYVDKNISQQINGLMAFAIKGFDLEKRIYFDYGFTLPGSEDFIWLDKNHLLMAKGSELFLKKTTDDSWKLTGNITLDSHEKISRMAYSKPLKKLVLTMERKRI